MAMPSGWDTDTESVTAPVAAWMMATLFVPLTVTYTRFAPGSTAIVVGVAPTTIVCTIVCVAGSITEIVLSLLCATYTRPFTGLNATPMPELGNGTVSATRKVSFVASTGTNTGCGPGLSRVAMYTTWLTVSTARPCGDVPASSVVTL